MTTWYKTRDGNGYTTQAITINTDIMKTRYFWAILLLLTGVLACKDDERFQIIGNDKEAPNPPTFVRYKPLVGGARVFYKLPSDKDVLSVNAEYINEAGKKTSFSASYFTDSLDVMGMADTVDRVIHLYAVDRAGNKSEKVPVTVRASRSALQEVTKSIHVLPAFNSIIVQWQNELNQAINIYVDMHFLKGGAQRSVTWVLSSKESSKTEIIEDIVLEDGESLSVNIRVGDMYGNITQEIEMGEVPVMNDAILPKDHWRLPNANDSIAGIPMCFGDAYECKSINVIDGIISRGETMNLMHTAGRGRTGKPGDGNAPWNYLIDMGDYYELSRIVTHQRHDNNATPFDPDVRGYYYHGNNVNQYNMYYLDEESNQWVFISQHTIPVPFGLSELEFAKMGAAGDMALMYPEAPAFTKAARWFRYEALTGFGASPEVLSEITLYGRKADNTPLNP